MYLGAPGEQVTPHPENITVDCNCSETLYAPQAGCPLNTLGMSSSLSISGWTCPPPVQQSHMKMDLIFSSGL